ncbi:MULTISPECIES: KPN_02809 family neutral zinc metallopeptidase [Vibrio]|jgi:predicted metalloprotease|uniref:KPN_02809 family neutral zinc metallopeptidase n=1 Tax=Vibrio TaxID=662 RepID=UPI000BFFBC1D|nr:neutral zinc metallopeptidase [Vibrio sp. PID17_43]PHJ40899.1 metalloprotease [Vibrio sp. PID17_43]
MRWRNSRRSSNVEDRRGQPGTKGAASNGLLVAQLFRFLPFLMKSKVGRLVLLGGVLFFGYQALMGDGSLIGEMVGIPITQQSTSPSDSQALSDENAQFVAAVLGTTESVWSTLLSNGYREPTLVLYTNTTSTGCGIGQAVSGPFYCPADGKIYLDLSFMDELKKLGAPGDFAFAYVIAHEVGHHVQNLLGTSGEVHRLQQQSSKVDANKLSVKLELQADCYAGVWGYYVNNEMKILDPGDMEEGIAAATAVGDDRLQEMAGRSVQPDSFTHGSSDQRVAWFKKGFESGDPEQCQTFN